MKAPGTKRLSVALSAVAYVLLGVPVWWHTTSLHRPPLPHEAIAAAAATAKARSALLPVSLQLVVAVPEGAEWSTSLSSSDILQSLQEAVFKHSGIEAPVRLSATVNIAGRCSSSSPGTDAAAHGPCGDPSAAAASILGGSSSSSQQQARQLDDWLAHEWLAKGHQGGVAAAAGAAGGAGHYTLLLLPAAAAIDPELSTSTEGGSSSTANVPQLVIGRYRHAWTSYDPREASQQPQQPIQLAAAAAVHVLNCCFGLHSSRSAIAAAETLPVSASGRTQLSFALLNADPTLSERYIWDFHRAEEEYMSKVAASLAPIAQITFTSQILHHTPARTAGKWSRKHNAHVVRHSQLPFFIDSEWAIESGGGGSSNLAAAVAADACVDGARPHHRGASGADESAVLEPHVLHFLVYVPAPDHRPLLLLGPKGTVQDSNSFWIPSWGGLLVLNPEQTFSTPGLSNDQQHSAVEPDYINSSTACTSSSWAPPTELNDEQYQHVATVVLAQLQALFGVAASISTHNNTDDAPAFATQHLPAGAAGFTAWQIDALTRQRVGFDVFEASRVLASLSKLVQELPNLEMPDLIGQQVSTALHDVESAWQHIAAGEYLAAAAAASAARAAAEAAFLHPAVLAQLNFPDSHKLGVYMPLFLPVAVPLVQGALGQLSRYITRRRAVVAAATSS